MATENDIVLVYIEDSPFFFARVESIWPDVKKDWFNIELLVLQIPVKLIVWTLKDIYIEGTEFFMGGKKMRIEVVHAPNDEFEMEENQEGSVFGSSNDNPFRRGKQSKNDNEAPRRKRRGIFKSITAPQGAGYEPKLRNKLNKVPTGNASPKEPEQS
ncbi:MAG: hypothetical protein HQK67_12140, partial [Desulfamplus sp.]|nr:hypothetical protein [Desulfamplus sp.]